MASRSSLRAGEVDVLSPKPLKPLEVPPHEAVTMLRQCSTCVAWKLKPNQAAPIFGGCARSGKTTLHYGDTAYNHYTTDLQSCSAWEAK